MKINIKKIKKFTEVVDAVEGRSVVNCLTHTLVKKLTVRADEYLDSLHLPRKCWQGARFYYRPSGPWAKSYGYTQGATCCTIERGSRDWFLIDVQRTGVYPQSSQRFDCFLPQQTAEIAHQQLDTKFNVLKPVENAA